MQSNIQINPEQQFKIQPDQGCNQQQTIQNNIISLQVVENIKRDGIAEKEKQIEQLKRDIKKMEDDKNKLEVNRDELINDVSDLRQLVNRVAKESEIKLLRERQKNKQLESKVLSLEKALQYSFKNQDHFSNVQKLWEDMD